MDSSCFTALSASTASSGDSSRNAAASTTARMRVSFTGRAEVGGHSRTQTPAIRLRADTVATPESGPAAIRSAFSTRLLIDALQHPQKPLEAIEHVAGREPCLLHGVDEDGYVLLQLLLSGDQPLDPVEDRRARKACPLDLAQEILRHLLPFGRRCHSDPPQSLAGGSFPYVPNRTADERRVSRARGARSRRP